ncbi:FKBP-type peptidyl-prolyl cis-trans isomerase [Gammaproteobacteria bacterium]|nr:FKBP-type peptidyl-prolyl cis-trans isomerase [Gammaproteobacteria bacterium]
MKLFIRRIGKLCIIALLGIQAAFALAQSNVDLQSEEGRIGYSIGVNIGQTLLAQGIVEGLDLDAFMSGMVDSINSEAKLTDEEMFAAIQIFQERMAAEAEEALTGNLASSAEFLAVNAAQEGVISLSSGLQYLVLSSGPTDGESPTTSDSVLAHYHGTLIDGTVFDSSVDRGEPVEFGVTQVISGWTEALQLMKIGDKWRLFLPPELAYGEQSPTPTIPPNSALIFEVELLEVL